MQQTEKADIDNLERLLRGIAEERERLRVELDAQSPNSPMRVQVLGDPTSPADKPETEANPTINAHLLIAGGIARWPLRAGRWASWSGTCASSRINYARRTFPRS